MSDENKNSNPHYTLHQDHQIEGGFAFPIITDDHSINNDQLMMMYNHLQQQMQNPNYLSFSNCLQGAVEYNTLSAAFDLSCSHESDPAALICNNINEAVMEVTAAADHPLTTSFSSKGSGVHEDNSSSKRKKDEGCDEDGGGNTKNVERKKKEEKKKKKKGRLAFMTRSEVDNLEDGYRWRKYGQKAVKNSPFPRSYYRCTSQKCNVKKLIERSQQDPSVVITTYEGRHNHHNPPPSATKLPPCLYLLRHRIGA